MMKNNFTAVEGTETLSIEIEVPDNDPTDVPPISKPLKNPLSNIQGESGSGHGIKIHVSGRHGIKSAWLSLSHLLTDGDPMEAEEMSRAMQSLGISDVGKIRVKSVECKALGFQQNFIPPQKLSAQMLEELSLLSGILGELEAQENTQLFREFLEEEKVKEVTDILCIYENFQQEQELTEELFFEESLELTMTME